ncbi:MAG: site-specific integrase [Pseudohongiellaceae bacterium]
MKAKLTAKCVNSLKPKDKIFKVWDTEIKGFFLRVSPKGRKTYALFYRVNGKANEYTLGIHGSITAELARVIAKNKAAEVAQKVDIQKEKKRLGQQTLAAKYSSLGRFIENRYKPWVESNLKSHKESLRTLNTDFSHLHGRQLENITPWDIQKWMAERKKDGLTESTINRRVATLKAVLSKAVEWQIIEASPLSGMKRLKTDNTPRIRYLSNEEEKRLRNALENRQDIQRTERKNHRKWCETRDIAVPAELSNSYTDYLKPIVILALNTGMRRGELFNLKWADVDLKGKLLTIEGKTAKSGHTRYIPLNSEAFSVLVAWRNQNCANGLVFPSPSTGSRLDNINSSWGNLISGTEIPNFRFHDLRHHFASKLVMAGVDLNTVRELLGHKDISTTLRYAHLAPEHKAAAVAMLNTAS